LCAGALVGRRRPVALQSRRAARDVLRSARRRSVSSSCASNFAWLGVHDRVPEVMLPVKPDALECERSEYLLLVYESPAEDGGRVASIVRELVVARTEKERARCAR